MCWNWTNFGALWVVNSTPVGCGSPFVGKEAGDHQERTVLAQLIVRRVVIQRQSSLRWREHARDDGFTAATWQGNPCLPIQTNH